MTNKGQIWLTDVSIAVIITLILCQLCLAWAHLVIDSTTTFHEITEKQKQLITASDRLINDPKCLAKTDPNVARVIPQTINSTKKPRTELGCHENYLIWREGQEKTSHEIVLKRLVFIDKEGGEVGVLEVW